MVIKEFYRIREDGVNLFKTYSDSGCKLIQEETGNIYDEAIDIEDSEYEYAETDIPIDGDCDVDSALDSALDSEHEAL